MFASRASVIYTTVLCALLLLAACASPPSGRTITPKATSPPSTVVPVPATPTAIPTLSPAPQHYTAHIVLRGVGRPDDLTLDQQGRLLFSDAHNGTVSRINTDGTVTTLLHGLFAPEGLVVLPDGTLLIAEQGYNRILSLAPGATAPTVLRTLPGVTSSAPCKDGVDGIALDPTSSTLIIPDSPTGDVYRMSLDGKSFTLLASGIARPVGATVDAQGTVYVADECGGALWRIAPNGKKTRYGGFGMLDDVVLDQHGDALVIDLQPAIHALIRMNLATGQREVLASQGFIEPQGLVIDAHDNIWVSDDYANIIMEFKPV
jgi:sugar lactone lactonase YvrE